jgi:TRAP-type C4-dicarboxylate transport system substrate-binding protein
LVLVGSSAAAEPIKLKFATVEPPQAFILSKIFMPWVEKVNSECEGIMKIEVYAGGTLGRDLATQLKVVTDGVADIAWIMNSYQPGRFADDLVVNIPFIAHNSKEGTLAIYRMYKKGMLRGYEDFIVVGLFAHAQYSLHTAMPVNSVKDLKGQKIRAAGKMQHDFMEAFGAGPVAFSITQTAENISRGVVKGTLSNSDAIQTFRIGDVAPNHFMLPLGTVTVMLALNKKSYESLPEKARAAIDRNIEPLLRSYGEKSDKADQEILEGWQKDPKHKVIIPSAQQIKEAREMLQPVIDAWKKENPKNAELAKVYSEEVAKVRTAK